MKRDQRIDIPLTVEEKSLITAAAERDSRTPTDWARVALLRAAKETQKELPE